MKPTDAPEPALLALTPRIEVTRRDAIKLLAGGIAALQAGCLEEAGYQEIEPYVIDPPEMRAGVPIQYTSVLGLDGFASGVLAQVNDGRPTKVDGNPLHPATRGGSLPFLQASILDLYDPQRLQEVQIGGEIGTWNLLTAKLQQLPPGELWLVMPPQSSPTLAALLARLAGNASHALHVVYHAPLDQRAAYRGHALVYGRPLEQQLDLSRADLVVALDADFLADGPMSPAWARAFAARRNPDGRMNRLWVAEPMQTATGTLADEHLPIPALDIAAVAVCTLGELRARGRSGPPLAQALVARARTQLGATGVAWTRALAADLDAHRGAGAVIVGSRQPPVVHALAQWIDAACGNVGGPVSLTEPALIDPLGRQTIDELVDAVGRGRVSAVVVIDCNPVLTAPHGDRLAQALRDVPASLAVALFPDETTRACKAVAPLAHALETWSDQRAADGTLAIGQPLIRPRFEVASVIDVVGALAGETRSALDLVRAQFDQRFQNGPQAQGAESPWTRALRTGVVANTANPAVAVTPSWPAAAETALDRALAPRAPNTIEIALARSQLYDGRFASSGWLQELPHPITKQTWGNAALLGPRTAAQLGIGNESVLRLQTGGGTIELPAMIVTDASEGSITVELGYGRKVEALPMCFGLGANGYLLRDDDGLLFAGTAAPTGDTQHIIQTQKFHEEYGRHLAPLATLTGYRADPNFTDNLRGPQPSLLPPQQEGGLQWGMSIDTSICTACSACMVACQAENNIPVVGPTGVDHGRHMNWIRVDRYVLDSGDVVNEPMPCQHCENAPCEYVCPVMATTHSSDGLNEQVYNRCIGTRFCSNNCPYKVRRFNWFAYESDTTRALQYNPDVTVRSRGVMEKCTYCVQRIRGAEHRAIVEHREIRPGEIVTACQAACPTNAIQFGSINEHGTEFAAWRASPRRFSALYELGTRPRTQYLAKVKNPRGQE